MHTREAGGIAAPRGLATALPFADRPGLGGVDPLHVFAFNFREQPPGGI